MSYQVSLDGKLNLPNLHDAEVMTMHLQDSDGSRDLVLGIKTELEEQYSLRCVDCKVIGLNELMIQNVLYDIEVYCGIDPRKRLGELIKNPNNYRPDDVERLAARIESNELTAIYLDASVGLCGLIVCKEFRIQKG